MRLVELKAVRWVAKMVKHKVPLIAEKLVVLLVDCDAGCESKKMID